MKCVYDEFKKDLAWPIIEAAIEDLVLNEDLVERTGRQRIVGYLVKKLSEQGSFVRKNERTDQL
ncbi:hypothetical protein DB345_12295 [Spartobacteria bacterium LR76]|nr:hypothetical protein DB345_12295 [Spartobacteria bacterium LR76]